MQKKKAVLFDLDGTVLDTIADIAAALNRALAAFGFKEKSVSQVQSYLGNGMLMLVRRATDFAAEDSLCLQIRELFAKEYANDMYSNTVPYQGVPQLLCDLGAAGVKVGVITNKDHRCALPMIKHYFGNAVDGVRGVKTDTDRKPNPQNTLNLLEEWGISPKDAVFVGDGLPDIEVAKNSNIEILPVGYGYTAPDILLEKSGVRAVSDVKELRRELFAKI